MITITFVHRGLVSHSQSMNSVKSNLILSNLLAYSHCRGQERGAASLCEGLEQLGDADLPAHHERGRSPKNRE